MIYLISLTYVIYAYKEKQSRLILSKIKFIIKAYE